MREDRETEIDCVQVVAFQHRAMLCIGLRVVFFSSILRAFGLNITHSYDARPV